MEKCLVAEVAVEQTAYHFDKAYDYLLPELFAVSARPGMRVRVPFGRANARRQGIITRIYEAEPNPARKTVELLLDEEPLLSGEMLKLAAWIKAQTFCTHYEALKAMLPPGAGMDITTRYCAVEEPQGSLSARQERIFHILRSSPEPMLREDLAEKMEGRLVQNDLDELVEMGAVRKFEDARRRVQDAEIRMVSLAPQPPAGFSREKATRQQKAVLELLETEGAASVREVRYFTGVSEAVVANLIKKGVLSAFMEETYRNPYRDRAVVTDDRSKKLNEEQQRAYEGLLAQYRREQPGTALLYGVTGSGKTQVYLNLIDRVLEENRGVIVMVPEISLTPQTLSLFHSRYGSRVAVFHSRLSMGQRLDEWKRVKNGEAMIAVGTRSAVFAPFDHLGLVIMDEEQESTYHSEASPRYHARDVARFRSSYHHALLVLASATPTVSTYSRAKSGAYQLYTLEKRFSQNELPEVVTVDMQKELREGNPSDISRLLLESLRHNKEEGRQSILLINRRGYHTFIKCAACQTVLTCPNCSVSLTYHSANRRVMCHYCGYSVPQYTKCPECGSSMVKYSGVGTQKVEEELGSLLPEARILRMDADTTLSRYAHEKKFEAFGRGEYDILIGTQMVAKGLDFPNVTLVGVLNTDSGLFSEDYRGYERSFSLLTQVCGRSGRGTAPGRAIIQTSFPDNPVIRLAARQDYPAFYDFEIKARRLMVFPPFCDLFVVSVSAEQEEEAKNGALRFFQALRKAAEQEPEKCKVILLGPSPSQIVKVNNRFRYELTVKARGSAAFRTFFGGLLARFAAEPQNRKIKIFADVNPDF